MEYDPQSIQCGNHLLDPAITVDYHEYTGRMQRSTQRFIQEDPTVIIRCKVCGHEARTDQFTLTYIPEERVWP